MYISELKLWNFRKYGDTIFDIAHPHLVVPFKRGMNVLIGENDSGKTAIIDALKLVLRTNTFDSIRVQHDDFYEDSEALRIELLLDEMSELEARNFTECTIPVMGKDYCQLRLVLNATRKNGRILPYEICAGATTDGRALDAMMKANLRITYLKPLRDAENELTAKKNSRLSQILQSHELLQETVGDVKHEFIKIFEDANQKIENWFSNDEGGEKSNRQQIKGIVDSFLKQFIDNNSESRFFLSNPTMRNILERIAIGILNSHNLGLGTLNRLFMATELLHLRKSGDNLHVCLIEELEAHIHPQAQMKVIDGLLKENTVQFIMTTHSPNITSKIKLGNQSDRNNILMCKHKCVFPLGPGYTKLNEKDYKYLDHFLDVTKSNLFFAKGILLVEGWAEEILLPIIANKIGIDFTQKEISIINVGSTAYLHFARIFMPQNGIENPVKCAIITDLDVRPDTTAQEEKEDSKKDAIIKKLGTRPTNIQLYVAKEWTLEWCLFNSPILSKLFKDSVAAVHNKTMEFKKDEKTKEYKDSFEDKLKEKLKDRSLDKVAVAQELASRIEEDTDLDFSKDDEYINYLLEAIRFVIS